MRLVVRGLAVTHHGHNIWKRHAGTVVLVGIEENTQTLELVRGSKHGALGTALLGEPEGETITMQVTAAMDLELELNLEACELHISKLQGLPQSHLPIGRGQRYTGEDPSLL